MLLSITSNLFLVIGFHPLPNTVLIPHLEWGIVLPIPKSWKLKAKGWRFTPTFSF